ncbi:MAG: hypothetical protein R6V14_04000 [Halanaerobiales bacterium]
MGYFLEEELKTLENVLENLQDADLIVDCQRNANLDDLEIDEYEEDTEDENFGQSVAFFRRF